MTVEVATYITDLQPANPPSSDPRAQGDDHLRLIKQVLQNTFPNANRAIFASATVAKSGNYSIVKADGESTIYASTAAGVLTLTLPSLAAGDAGWRVYFVKTSTDGNPLFIAPATGTLTSGAVAGCAKARRAIPGVRNTAIWDGAAWYVTRSHALPLGSVITWYGNVLPAGFEWPNGVALSSSANYPEYFGAMGGIQTPDLRGVVCAGLDTMGSAAGRLGGGIINGNALGAIAGADVITLTQAQMPSHYHSANIYDPSHTHGVNQISYWTTNSGSGVGGGGAFGVAGTTSISIQAATTGVRINSSNGLDTTYSAGSGGSHGNLQPTVMMGKLLVVE